MIPKVQNYHVPAVRSQTELPASKRPTRYSGQRTPLLGGEDHGSQHGGRAGRRRLHQGAARQQGNGCASCRKGALHAKGHG
jgi:hypothetical protein